MKTKNLLTVMIIVFIISIGQSYAQWWHLTGGDPTTTATYLGENGLSANPLRLMTLSNLNIDLYTNNTRYLSLSKLGNLNIVDAYKGYQIDSNMVLWYNNDINNIFVGVQAGNSNPSSGATDNVFIGYQAGFFNTGSGGHGYRNVYVGSGAGTSSVDGDGNSYYGYFAGNNELGQYNTYLGCTAGQGNSGITTNSNTFIGRSSGYTCKTSRNTFIGDLSGWYYTGTSGQNGANVYIGYNAQGSNSNGSDPENNLINSIAIGANTEVPYNNQFILGNNDMNIGIGLSGPHTGMTAPYINDGPQNKLEINAGTDFIRETTAQTTHGASGLQFRKLNAHYTPESNPGDGVLSVNNDGNVIYVPSGKGVGFGSCSITLPTLSGNSGIDMSGNNINFVGGGSGQTANNVVIGYSSCNSGQAKLDVKQNSNTTGSTGLRVWNQDLGSSWSNPSYGIKGMDYIYSNYANPYRCAGYFKAQTSTPFASTQYYQNWTINPETPFAIFTPQMGGRVAFGFPSFAGIPSALLAVNGNSVNFGTAYYSNGNSIGSDSIFKTNILNINSATRNLLNHLRPVEYFMDTIGYSYMNFDSRKQFGFIAQEMDTVYDNLVSTMYLPTQYDSTDTVKIHDSIYIHGITYTSIIPLLVSGYQEHDSLINSIQNNFKGAQNGAWIDTGKVEWGTSPLLHNTTLPMVSGSVERSNEYSIYFTGQSSMSTYNPVDVGIGYYDTTASLRAKLDVVDSTFTGEDFSFTNQFAGRFYQTGRYNADGGDELIGVAGITDVMPGDGYMLTNIGGDFRAKNSRINIGGRGTASDSLGDKYGLIGQSSGNNNCFGIYGNAAGSNTNYGIYGGATTGGGIVSYAGYFSGDLAYTGALISISDSTVKQNIHPISGAQAILNQVHPKVYNFDTAQYGYMNLKGGTEYGVLAQDLMNVLPSAVKDVIQPAVYDNQNNMIHPALHLKGVDYIEFIPLLIQSNHQMDSTIQALQSQLIALQNCCDRNQPPQQNSIRQKDGGNGDNGNDGSDKKLENGNIHAIELSNATGSPIIYQNIPNPFSNGGTKIRYFIPDNTNNPQIVFFDEFGGKLSTFNILETGMGELDVTASNLSSGVYSYSLIINGKAIDTKKMIFQK